MKSMIGKWEITPEWILKQRYVNIWYAEIPKREGPMFTTKEQVADDIVDNHLDESNKKYLKTINEDALIQHHHSVGQWIRNWYSFWDASCPLTKPWHDDSINGTNKYIVDDVDHHPCHPDAVSMDILVLVWKKVNGNGKVRSLRYSY